jgi:hypothetical protein
MIIKAFFTKLCPINSIIFFLVLFQCKHVLNGNSLAHQSDPKHAITSSTNNLSNLKHITTSSTDNQKQASNLHFLLLLFTFISSVIGIWSMGIPLPCVHRVFLLFRVKILLMLLGQVRRE